jgi:hypothetical protein
MRFVAPLLAGLAGCSFQHGQAAIGDGRPQDGTVIIDTPPPDTQICLGAGVWALCLNSAPSAPVDLTGLGTFDTGSDSHCLSATPPMWSSTQPSSCFVVGSSVTLNDTLTVTGSRPLVLVATDTITIGSNGLLDVSSRRGGTSGPGATASVTCNAAVAPDNNLNTSSGGGGGAGGSFVGVNKGGDGGRGSTGGNAATGGKAANLVPPPTTLRPGCSGSNGGDGDNRSNDHGLGGATGGAAYLVAGTSITVSGIINASGAGATGGDVFGGGGGGGSGGMLVFYAPMINASSGKVLANGGAGQGGGDSNTGPADGMDVDPTMPLTPANGGPASGGGSDNNPGGHGFAQGANQTPGGTTNAQDGGGGGGGGGGGYILTHKPLTGAIVSPTPAAL